MCGLQFLSLVSVRCEIEETLERLKQLERELTCKEQELAERERRLTEWENRLMERSRSCTPVNLKYCILFYFCMVSVALFSPTQLLPICAEWSMSIDSNSYCQ